MQKAPDRICCFRLWTMSIFMAGTLVGGIYVKIMGLPDSLATMIQGTILFCVLGFDLVTRYKIRLVNKTQEVAKS